MCRLLGEAGHVGSPWRGVPGFPGSLGETVLLFGGAVLGWCQRLGATRALFLPAARTRLPEAAPEVFLCPSRETASLRCPVALLSASWVPVS